MSAILWIGGAVYLICVLKTVGQRYDNDFCTLARGNEACYISERANQRVSATAERA